MLLNISPQLEQFVKREVANGNFLDEEAVIEHALGLMLRDYDEAVPGMRAGLNDVEAGRTQPLDEAFREIHIRRAAMDQASPDEIFG